MTKIFNLFIFLIRVAWDAVRGGRQETRAMKRDSATQQQWRGKKANLPLGSKWGSRVKAGWWPGHHIEVRANLGFFTAQACPSKGCCITSHMGKYPETWTKNSLYHTQSLPAMHGALLIINVTEIRALIRFWTSWWFDSWLLLSHCLLA